MLERYLKNILLGVLRPCVWIESYSVNVVTADDYVHEPY